ncbi:MAG: primosomal protein N' [Gammaproteobacteria bacterium]|nr:primosomal protein N' [Gammaproteobacteria bacterium]NNC57041.1 primosomal protein N' [Woeseiaceae bacterium]NNL49883.1 primosomal protein N' [Woeseiaceae bacterium]
MSDAPISNGPLLTIAVNVPLSREFDYLPPKAGALPAPGCRVLVPFGRRQQVGLVLGHANESALPAGKLRHCDAAIDKSALLDANDLKLIRFTSDYYHHPIGEVVAAALPAFLRQGKPLHPTVETITISDMAGSVDIEALAKRAPRQAELLEYLLDAGGNGVAATRLTEELPNWRRAATGLFEKGYITRFEARADDFDETLTSSAAEQLTLNDDQGTALAVLRGSDTFGAYLIDGVTGSGKTEVYLQRMQDFIEQGKQVLVLAPEIGLTPQLVARLRNRLGIEPALLHSGLSDIERLAAWRAARSGAARLLVGTRSAIFTPLKNPGLIIVDEEHDHSFKQQEGLRYSARDLAIVRAKQLDIPVILGTATPTLELLQHCRDGNYKHLHLPIRAGGAEPPTMHLVDTVRMPATDGISEPLGDAIDNHLKAGGQALIFLNRRGFAPTLICASCGHIAGCERCDSRLTVHARSNQLRCHHCGACRPLDTSCGECGEIVKPLGEGTERLEETLRLRFPGHAIMRVDSDSTQKKGAIHDVLEQATQGDADILVGTQMLSKGHHFPNLTLVGIVNADQGLFGTDFRSAERLAQSIVQVAGRAGRESRRGDVLIQTAFPDHPFWSTLIEGGYGRVAEEALAEREATRWPPFTRLALIRAAAHRHGDALEFLELARRRVADKADDTLRILGPVDAPMARKAGRYRAQLLLQSGDRQKLHTLLRELRPALEQEPMARRVRWSIDVDPIELF